MIQTELLAEVFMKQSKYISIFLVITLITTLILTGCGKSEEEKSTAETTQAAILQEFSNLSEAPRDSDESMSSIKKYIKKRLKDMGISVKSDEAGNLMAEKPATEGYENVPVTILHTNMDMVTVASPSIMFNPEKDGITPLVNEEDKTITGNNTNLGAKSGIGMATAFFVLQNSVNHGPLKVIFTVDGEKDMSGAQNINPEFLNGSYLINLNNDTNVIENGSAYSSILKASEKIKKKNTQNKYSFVLVADGFVGGNSGLGSQNDQGNPIKFLAEVLALAKGEGLMFELNDFCGGENVYDIPQMATATITVNEYEKSKINSIFDNVKKEYLKNHANSDPDAQLNIIETTVPDKALKEVDTGHLISFLYGITDGKYNDKSTTTASSNIGTVNITNNKINMGIFVQGKLDASVGKIAAEHSAIAKISNYTMNPGDFISGFYTSKSAYLPTRINEIYNNTLKETPKLSYRPTRTELGFFQEKNPEIQIISIGPTIRNEGKIEEYVSLPTISTPATAVIEFLSGLNN